MSSTKSSTIKVRITQENGSTEVRRLEFTPDPNSEGAKSHFEYHKTLCSFVLNTLGDMYPDLPVGSFNDRVRFTVVDNETTRVTFASIDEFPHAVDSQYSADRVIRVGVKVLDSAVTSTQTFAASTANHSLTDNSPATSKITTPSIDKALGPDHPVSTQNSNATDVNSDLAAPFRVFAAQVIPGLANLLMHTAQWIPQIQPDGSIVTPAEGLAVPPSAQQPNADGDFTSKTVNVAAEVQIVANDLARAIKSGALALRIPASPGAPSSTTTGEPPATSTKVPVLHLGVACDGCNMNPIEGVRYKCAVRNDFDLCEACEARMGADSPFPFLKIWTPSHTPSAIICLLRPDQPQSVQRMDSTRKDSASRDQGTGIDSGVDAFPTDVVYSSQLNTENHMQRSIWPCAQSKCENHTQPEQELLPAMVDGSAMHTASACGSSGLDEQVAASAEEQAETKFDLNADKTSEASIPTPEEDFHPSDCEDMLAASMRSLASSMNASFAVSSAPQNSKPRGGPAAGDVSHHATPMARFVSDVSITDGSILPANTPFVKTWCMRNEGTVAFPPDCRFLPVGGDLMVGPEEGVVVEQHAPGEEFHMSVTLTTPSLNGRYIGYWRLRTASGQHFGHRVWVDVRVTCGTTGLTVEGALDGDWDLVNMQHLSKAMEDTKGPRDDGTATTSPSAASPIANVAAAIPATSAHVSTTTTPVISPTSEACEEPKTVPEEGISIPALAPNEGSAPTVSASGHESAHATHPPMKWPRELGSLAEMGFSNTTRSVALLEKYCASDGAGGFELVLNELLTWREISIQ